VTMAQEGLTISEAVDPVVERLTIVREIGLRVKNGLHQRILQGGEPARRIADLLHGTWLGHPVHSVLTDATIGAWLFGTVFDLLSLIRPTRRLRDTADTMTTVGVITSLPTATAGLTDYSAIKEDAVTHGTLHAMLNSAGLVLYLLSLRARWAGRRGAGVRWSLLGFGTLTASAWLGGELVYRLRVSVNHAPEPSGPIDWQPALAEVELPPDFPMRVEVDGTPVLLYRENGTIAAIGAVCAHAGGPLDEGQFYDGCVQCPWHDSVFDLHSGRIVHGPATYPQPRYEARTHNGQIEIRVARE